MIVKHLCSRLRNGSTYPGRRTHRKNLVLLMAAMTQPKLVLHFDINETILMCDPVAGIDFATAVNNIIAKFVFVRRIDDGAGAEYGKRPKHAKYQWHDGSPFDIADRSAGCPPPAVATTFERPAGHKTYYESFRLDAELGLARFTADGMPGSIYRPLRDELLQRLVWPHAAHNVLGHDGRHFLLPALFNCVCELSKRGRDVSVVFRTYGTDVPEVKKCWNAFSNGEHPDFGAEAAGSLDILQQFALREDDCTSWGLWHPLREKLHSHVVLRRYDENVYAGRDAMSTLSAKEELVDEDAIVQHIAKEPCFALRDDYQFWRQQRYDPAAGKPVWLTADDTSCHHIFFDDNIHDKADDSIVAVRARLHKDEPYRTLDGENVRRLQNVCLVKANACQAILDPDYFLRHIEQCEANLKAMREDGRLAEIVASRSPL